MPEFTIEYTEDGGIRVIEVPPELQNNARIGGIPISGAPNDDDIIKYDEPKTRFNFENDVVGSGFDSNDFDNEFSQKITDDLSEGSGNLYFTEERVDDRVSQLLQAGSGIDISYDDANDELTITDLETDIETIQDKAWQVLGGSQNLITVTYDDINDNVDFQVEPDLSQYDNSTTGFISDFSTKTTDNLPEGSGNLYYTEERVDDRVAALITGGNNTTVSYNDTANKLTIESSDTLYQGGTNITVDGNNDINFDGLGTFTTDDLSEGTANLYFSKSRVFAAGQDQLFPGDRISITEDAGNETFTFAVNGNSSLEVGDGGTSLSTDASLIDFANGLDVTNPTGEELEVSVNIDTDDVPEGTSNLYFTDSRAVTAVESASSLALSGSLTLPNGTSVNDIKTATGGSSDNALVTEAAVETAIANGGTDLSINTIVKTADFTATEAENGSAYLIDNTVTVTLPDTLSNGWNAIFINRGGGTITFATSGTATLQSPNGQNTLEIQNAQAPVIQRADNFYLGGQLGA